MAHGVDPGRFFDDNDVIIEMANDEAIGSGLLGPMRRVGQQRDEFALLESACGVGTDRIPDLHPPRFDDRFDGSPRWLRFMQPRTQHLGQRMAFFGTENVEEGSKLHRRMTRLFDTDRNIKTHSNSEPSSSRLITVHLRLLASEEDHRLEQG